MSMRWSVKIFISGTLHFVREEEDIPHRDAILRLFEALEAPNRDAILDGLREVQKRLAVTTATGSG